MLSRSFRCTNRSPRPWQGSAVKCPQGNRLQMHAAQENINWRGGVERMQQSVMEGAVSAMNGMISNLEKSRVTPAEHDFESTDIYMQSSPSDEAIQTTRLSIKAKASVFRPVTVRCLTLQCSRFCPRLTSAQESHVLAVSCGSGDTWQGIGAVLKPSSRGLQLSGCTSGAVLR